MRRSEEDIARMTANPWWNEAEQRTCTPEEMDELRDTIRSFGGEQAKRESVDDKITKACADLYERIRLDLSQQGVFLGKPEAPNPQVY